jgi:hypothetical protein
VVTFNLIRYKGDIWAKQAEGKAAAAAAQHLYLLTMDRIQRVGQTTIPVTLVTSQVMEGITLLLKSRK